MIAEAEKFVTPPGHTTSGPCSGAPPRRHTQIMRGRQSAAIMAGAAVACVWSQGSLCRQQPAMAAGYALIGIGFAATALLLANEHGQRGNAGLFGGLAAVWIMNQMIHRPLGPFL